MGDVVKLDIVRVRDVLGRHRESLAEAKIIERHCYEQLDTAERERSDAERRLYGALTAIEERAPDVWAQLTEEERARG